MIDIILINSNKVFYLYISLLLVPIIYNIIILLIFQMLNNEFIIICIILYKN